MQKPRKPRKVVWTEQREAIATSIPLTGKLGTEIYAEQGHECLLALTRMVKAGILARVMEKHPAAGGKTREWRYFRTEVQLSPYIKPRNPRGPNRVMQVVQLLKEKGHEMPLWMVARDTGWRMTHAATALNKAWNAGLIDRRLPSGRRNGYRYKAKEI